MSELVSESRSELLQAFFVSKPVVEPLRPALHPTTTSHATYLCRVAGSGVLRGRGGMGLFSIPVLYSVFPACPQVNRHDISLRPI